MLELLTRERIEGHQAVVLDCAVLREGECEEFALELRDTDVVRAVDLFAFADVHRNGGHADAGDLLETSEAVGRAGGESRICHKGEGGANHESSVLGIHFATPMLALMRTRSTFDLE